MTEQQGGQPQPAPQQSAKKTSTGLDENVAGLLCYVLGWITGIIFLLLEKDNKFVRFHAIQSICVFGVITVIEIIFGWIPIIGWIINSILGLVAFILWIVLMVKAYQGQKWKLPGAGNFAEKKA
jgi:uncharacterized membrane protein